MTLSMDIILSHLNCRPEHGFTISSLLFITGWLFDNKEVVTLCLQWTSFIIAIAVGCLTLYAKYKDLRSKTKNKFRTKNTLK